MRTFKLLGSLCLILNASSLPAQDMTQFKPFIDAIVRDPNTDTRYTNLVDVNANNRQGLIQYLRTSQTTMFATTFNKLLQAVENGRVDEQSGGSATAGGAASAAEKAGITGLITGALESGAMTQTLSQNVLTLRGNADGLFRFLTGQPVIPICASPTDTSCDASPWNNLELTTSLAVSGSNTQAVSGQTPTGTQVAGLLTSDKRQFSSASARYVILNSRDLRSPSYRTAWLAWYNSNLTQLKTVGGDLLKGQDDIFNPLMLDKDAKGNLFYDQWLMDTVSLLKGVKPVTEAGLEAVFQKQLAILETRIRVIVPDLNTKLDTASSAYGRFFALNNQGIELANKPMLTFEATYSEPSLQPKVVDATAIFAWSPKAKGTTNPGTLTLNGGVSFYTKAQPTDTRGNTSTIKDAQFAGQFDRPLGTSGAATLSIGGYFQYQLSPGLINIPAGTVAPGTNIPLPGNAMQLLAPKGTIAVAQASITLQLPNSGVKVPIGISWSNRTDLLTGNEIRAHIGFTFDTHSLLLTGSQQ